MGEDICYNISDKGLISNYIQRTHTTQQQTNDPIKKWTEGLNRRFSKDTWMVK